MSRFYYAVLLWFLAVQLLDGQVPVEGKVSYLTSRHVYVRFTNTDGISDGDTLYVLSSGDRVPVLRVLNHSSTSCVCEPLGGRVVQESQRIVAIPGETGLQDTNPEPVEDVAEMNPQPNDTTGQSRAGSKPGKPGRQVIHGRLAVASYTHLSGNGSLERQRMRYTFSLAADHIGNSNLSLKSYLSFRHTDTNLEEIKANIYEGLKIYNLSARYDFSESMYLAVGRRTNPNLSSAGAIDGLQFEKSFGSLSAGIVAGSRPDYSDYRINPGLFQYGGYLGYESSPGTGKMKTTLAFMEQKNQSHTDRRFLYLQHTNNVLCNLFFFASAEMDLFRKTDSTDQNVFQLYNTYISLRYRIIRHLTVSVSYNARNNLIYYESYKDFLEKLLDDETLQGWRARLNYRPWKSIYLGVSGAYRYRKNDPDPTRNVRSYVTWSKLPLIGGSFTASVTWMETACLDGSVYGMGYHRELFSGKVYTGLQYHYVDHLYRNNELKVNQHVGEASISWSVYRKLSLSLFYEGILEPEQNAHRIYLNLSQRF